jgi:hypothetical protein
MTYWHGGPRIKGDRVTDAQGMGRSGDFGVHVTTERTLAEVYASTVPGTGWVYEVEPVGEPVPVPSKVGGPTISYRVPEARIIRRFTISKAEQKRTRAVVRLAW